MQAPSFESWPFRAHVAHGIMVNAGSGGSELTLVDLEDVGWVRRFLPSAWPPFALHALGEESKDGVIILNSN